MKELINLAKEKGFKAQLVRLHNNINDKTVISDWFFLWMCELQRWLREKHTIHVDIESYEAIDPEIKVWYDYIVQDFEGTYIKNNDMSSSYKERLEKGLNEALKLLL